MNTGKKILTGIGYVTGTIFYGLAGFTIGSYTTKLIGYPGYLELDRMIDQEKEILDNVGKLQDKYEYALIEIEILRDKLNQPQLPPKKRENLLEHVKQILRPPPAQMYGLRPRCYQPFMP